MLGDDVVSQERKKQSHHLGEAIGQNKKTKKQNNKTKKNPDGPLPSTIVNQRILKKNINPKK